MRHDILTDQAYVGMHQMNLTNREIKWTAHFIPKLSIKDSDVVREGRVLQEERSPGVVLVWVRDGDGQDEGKEHKQHGEEELGEHGSKESQGIVETLQEHCPELLYPKSEASVGS